MSATDDEIESQDDIDFYYEMEQKRLTDFGKTLGLVLIGFDHLGSQWDAWPNATFVDKEPPHQQVTIPYWLIIRIGDSK